MARSMTYAESGVDIDAGDRMVEMIRHHVARTNTPRVLGGFGGFAGCFRLDYNEKLFKRNYKDPVLVACTDGVGSKVKLAAELGIYDTVGQDLVAMSVNDMIVQGSEPLFFLDYIGTHRLDPATMTQIVKGVADGCELARCALLGGETAEMPDIYAEGDFDLAGFAVGVCELKKMIVGDRPEPGDVILGLASSGIHSNGYSLVRAIVKEAGLKIDNSYDELETDRPLGEVLLTPTRIYVKPIIDLLAKYKVKKVVGGMSHITGGGLPGNLPRSFPNDLDARMVRKSWKMPSIFRFLQERGNIKQEEMDRVFNCGVGYCLIVRPAFAEAISSHLTRMGETVHRLGTMVRGSGKVNYVD